jgi:tetraacyldisaccharide 4'-kinase
MKEHRWLKLLLTPLSWPYALITACRNRLYDRRFFKVQAPSPFTISVGNLTVGGTGKTPVVEYLTNRLSQTHPMAILSRGYGRKTKGLFFADGTSTAAHIGDEPLQFYKKYGESVVVAVCENRVFGASAIQDRFPDTALLILDDAYQHRAIGRDCNLLLSDFNRPFYDDLPFPAGRLRESRSGAVRADAVIVTKCPAQLSDEEKQIIRCEIGKYARSETPVYFSSIRYAQPISFTGHPVALKKVKVIVGIASPEPFLTFVRKRYELTGEIIRPDHHNYSVSELEALIENIKSDTFVLTTEKDMVKLKPLAENFGCADRFAFVPIEIDFGSDSQAFERWLDHIVTL